MYGFFLSSNWYGNWEVFPVVKFLGDNLYNLYTWLFSPLLTTCPIQFRQRRSRIDNESRPSTFLIYIILHWSPRIFPIGPLRQLFSNTISFRLSSALQYNLCIRKHGYVTYISMFLLQNRKLKRLLDRNFRHLS